MTDLEGTATPEATAPRESHDELPADQEPVVTGFWALMYITLLNR